ncbi:nuclear condensing complex subunit [Obelidium mucronatum]|nr:nuclear condensing complex subunit [Obelidium mucronatum]
MEIKMEEIDAAHAHIVDIFSQASLDTASHSRLAKELLLMGPSAAGKKSSKKPVATLELKPWLLGIWKCILCVLSTKRVAREAAQKSLRFIESLVKNSESCGGDLNQQTFVTFLLTRLSRGSNAKQAHVRFRVCQLLFLLLNHVSEIDDDMHQVLKTVLIQRSHDKDAHVRVQASMALTRFQGPPDDVDEQVVDVLIDLMTGDPCADVRKTLLWNTDLSSRSLIPLLQRATDVDVGVRRMVYQKFAASIPDMLDLPREVRLALLTVGLKDRDAGVRKKCKALLCDVWWKVRKWNAVEFLKELDVRTVAAEEALAALISANLITTDFVTDQMWNEELTLEFVFFASIYARSLNEKKAEEKLQDFLPSLTSMATLLSKFGALIVNPPSEDENEIKAIEFVLCRLLQITEYHDFSDEMGRRSVSDCIAKLLVCEDLPTENLQFIIRILQKMSMTEADVLLTVTDAVSDILEASEDMANTQDIEPGMHKLLVQMQCLEIIRALLEQIQKPPCKDSSFLVLLHRFIIPSVRSNNALLRQTGIHCLGLACYIDRTLSLENANLFLHAFQAEENDGKKIVLQILFDLIMVHGVTVVDLNAVVVFILACLQDEDPGLLTLAAEGATKLMMMKFIGNEQILEALLVLYFHPSTVNQRRLRQCLTCFFPMYALSSAENQALLASSVIAAFTSLTLEFEESGEGIAPSDVAAQLGEWTDYRRLVSMEQQAAKGTDEPSSVHGLVAISLLEAMMKEPDIQKEGSKMLNILFIDSTVGDDQKKRILKLCGDVQPVSPFVMNGVCVFEFNMRV